MKPTVLLLLLALICYGACKKDTNANTPLAGVRFTIIRSSGLVGTPEYYLLNNGKLYNADTTQALPTAKYAIASNLAALPQYFFSHPDSSWGCAVCADGPALYITWKKDSSSYYWSIDDSHTDMLPPAVAAYAVQANAALDSLK